MMNAKAHQAILLAVAAVLALGAPGPVTAAREPQVLAAVGDTFAAPYDAVWDATLKALGAVKPRRADKATGQIETEVFPFIFGVGPGIDGGTQILWISFAITVAQAGAQQTQLQVQPRVHDALLNGFTPGPISNPWVDLFARIRGHLGRG